MSAEFSICLGRFYLSFSFKPFHWKFNIFNKVVRNKSVLLYCGPFCLYIDIE